jgi:hypothetical protein
MVSELVEQLKEQFSVLSTGIALFTVWEKGLLTFPTFLFCRFLS